MENPKPQENNPERPPALADATGSEVEPLKAVEWQFPLGGCHARLSIVAAPENEIMPEDMDALREMAALIKRQLERRAHRGSVKLLCKICGQSWDEAHTANGDKCPNANPPNAELNDRRNQSES